MINIQVDKNNNENTTSLIRRFTKRVQGAGILNRVRSLRYKDRKQSRYTRKKMALKQLGRRTYVNEMIKLGKMTEKTRGR